MSFCAPQTHHGFPPAVRPILLLICMHASLLMAQTDEVIFREFRFDFATPGARANAMGRAFTGLSDEATAAYNNPAGISALTKPELSIEFRANTNSFNLFEDNDNFTITSSDRQAGSDEFDTDRIGFASYAFSWRKVNFSLFYVNNLDYRRDPIDETIAFRHNVEDYSATYLNDNHVRQIKLDTMGFSFSKDFGKLDIGFAVAMAELNVDFEYFNALSSLEIFVFDPRTSVADATSRKPAYVFGALYKLHPKLKLGLSYKLQPRFSYIQSITNTENSPTEFPDGVPRQITLKVPDSFQIGLGYQPNDFWTLLLDVDWVRYKQTMGDNLTLLSSYNAPFISRGEPFTFQQSDFDINDKPELRFGAEYLKPIRNQIMAFRFGGFLDPDHRPRFIGVYTDETEKPLYDLADFVFNTEEGEDNPGYTLGLGWVNNNKIQLDVAFVKSERFERLVTSFLYRF